jgi:hypothetical protein
MGINRGPAQSFRPKEKARARRGQSCWLKAPRGDMWRRFGAQRAADVVHRNEKAPFSGAGALVFPWPQQ